MTPVAYPVSPGLLIAMAFQKDSYFSIKQSPRDDLYSKQTVLIRKAYEDYVAFLIGEKIEPRSLKEITGFGAYEPVKEDQFRGWATTEALQYAENLLAFQDFLSGEPA